MNAARSNLAAENLRSLIAETLNLDVKSSSVIQVSKVILEQMETPKNQDVFAKIEKICEDLQYGELVIKVQDGKPVFLESIKKQIKLY